MSIRVSALASKSKTSLSAFGHRRGARAAERKKARRLPAVGPFFDLGRRLRFAADMSIRLHYGRTARSRNSIPMVVDHEVLTSTEVCEMLHISRTTLYKLIGAGKIPRFRVGSDWRFRKDLILRWMAERTVG